MVDHDWSQWGPLAERYSSQQPRKMLSLDGGGIRGVLSLQILARIENLLKSKLGADDNFRLCDYFDYIAGTSTGAIIATALARGLSVAEIFDLYMKMSAEIFRPSPLSRRWKSLYSSKKIENELKQLFIDKEGNPATLEPHNLRCLLLVVVKNVTTDSAWPISSNPSAKYNHSSRSDSNLKVPLWQLVRASTAAPIYFPPEVIRFGDDKAQAEYVFADGSLTPFNNPAFQLFKMATLPEYRLEWPRGESQMLLVSIGTGKTPNNMPFHPHNFELPIWKNVPSSFLGVLNSIQDEQDVNCRAIGRCLHGSVIDSEVGALTSKSNEQRQFTYIRYDADLSLEKLLCSGFAEDCAKSIRCIDKIQAIPNLVKIGKEVAEDVKIEHFDQF